MNDKNQIIIYLHLKLFIFNIQHIVSQNFSLHCKHETLYIQPTSQCGNRGYETTDLQDFIVSRQGNGLQTSQILRCFDKTPKRGP